MTTEKLQTQPAQSLCVIDELNRQKISILGALRTSSGELLAHDHHHPFTLCMKLQGNETCSLVCDVSFRPQKKPRACVDSSGRAGPLREDRAVMHACALARSGGGRNRYSKAYCSGLDLQARGTDLIKRGKWKGILDCQIVSREPWYCTGRTGEQGLDLCATARLGICTAGGR